MDNCVYLRMQMNDKKLRQGKSPLTTASCTRLPSGRVIEGQASSIIRLIGCNLACPTVSEAEMLAA